MSAKRTAFFRQGCGRQHGAALMVMLVIMIIGAAAILVSALSSSSLQIERDRTTADALAKAKAALIGRAVADITSPGSLPCPDIDDTGIAQSTVGQPGGNCPNYIGRLPWKTLGLPDLRDGSGERLWYALSPNFRDYVSLNPINSDSQGTLTISGTSTASNVIAIVFSPSATLSGQSRSSTQTASCTTTGTTVANSLCATNYLEGSNANLSTAATPNTAFQTAASSSTFNDEMINITHDALFQPVETRIAREAKKCLDAYAADSTNTYHRYPWAASDIDTSYTGSYNTLFGRIPVIPITTTQNIDATATTMLTALSNLQAALNAYSTNNNTSTKAALLSAGQTLATAADNADNNPGTFQPYNYLTDQAQNAGTSAQNLANGGSSVSTVQNYVNSTNSSLIYNHFIDGSMPSTNIWPSSCVFTSSYWSTWQNEVFYQVAAGNSPGTSVTVCNTSCLTINGSGNPASGNGTYRATVIIGRAHSSSLNTSTANTNPPSYYLEKNNLHDSTQTYPGISNTFETYRPTDNTSLPNNYTNVNDLVLCLDGYNAVTNPTANCK